ncbi:MAG: quinolinate synthase NadA [Lachnospiraceae bacterium]|nr:quinolinate synthase NadA [Lachnospiraceae bacterium]
MDERLVQRIRQLKEEKDVVILAHYYVDGEVQQIADYVGDSYYLAKIATKVKEDSILFCGVSFMGESAKILNPEKRVVMADSDADCPMAHMVTPERIAEVRAEYGDEVAVVCYVNSTAEIKAVSDVCVTSSNALRVVERIDADKIFFVPDNNLGRYVAEKIPQKQFIFHDGYCHVHKGILAKDVERKKKAYPDALVLTHPECTMDVLALSDFVGSTSEIIDYATASDKDNFIVCTETGVFFELMQKNPEKKFYPVGNSQFCPDMKLVTLDRVIGALESMKPEVVLSLDIMKEALIPLQKMLELAE